MKDAFLKTPETDSVGDIPWQDYPRPQLRRDSYLCLNGLWDFAVSREEFIPAYPQKIRVPFPPESPLSGVVGGHKKGEFLHYRRFFTLPEGFVQDRVLLHLGAVDQKAWVKVNGRLATIHEGGYLPIDLDITEMLRSGENELQVLAVDDLDKSYPYGKQTDKPKGMWYTSFSGIWQTVWLESVPRDYIRSLRISTTAKVVTIEVQGGLEDKILTYDGKTVHFRGDRVTIVTDGQNLWSPENPKLTFFTLESGGDTVHSYFALRTLEIKQAGGKPRLLLNGKPYFFHGLLDQGYWPDGLVLPASPQGYRRDILGAKELGFNTLRKHIKVEPELFYYECDRLGMIVWQDMVNNGSYYYVRDTALPNLGFQKRDDKAFRVSRDVKEKFLTQAEQTVKHLYNHPSICQWTIFNEAWGQFDADEVTQKFQLWDRSRLIDSTSGWFQQRKNPMESLHIYFKPVKLPRSRKPIALTEFGGIVCRIREHSVSKGKPYGYGQCKTREEFQKRFLELYETQIVPAIAQGLCACIYTQISDVENEVNGLFTYDRRVCKLEKEPMQELAKKLRIP